MGRRGPAPKPTALKLLTGNPGRRRANSAEPKPDPTIPDCPDFLDANATAEWQRIVPELARLKLLTLVDRAALAAYCQAWSRWQKAEGLIAKQGLTLKPKGATGIARRHPAVSIAAESMKLMKQFLIEFGLTPAARSRVTSNEKPDADDFDTFLTRGKQSG